MTRNVRVLKVLLGIGVSASLGLGIRDAVAAPTRGYCTDPLATGYCVTAANCQQVCRDAGYTGSYAALCNFSTHCCYCDPDA